MRSTYTYGALAFVVGSAWQMLVFKNIPMSACLAIMSMSFGVIAWTMREDK